MQMKIRVLMLLFSFLFAIAGHGQNIFGKWKTVDDRTGNPKAIISIYEKNGLMYGDVVEILEAGKEDSLCTKCDGIQKDMPVLGMTVIHGAKETDGGIYKGNRLFDPEQAMTFRCKIWLNPDNLDELKVRGYLAFIYRTQTWLRVGG